MGLGVESGAPKDAALHSRYLSLGYVREHGLRLAFLATSTKEDFPRPGVNVITTRLSGERYHSPLSSHTRLTHEKPSTLSSESEPSSCFIYLSLPRAPLLGTDTSARTSNRTDENGGSMICTFYFVACELELVADAQCCSTLRSLAAKY